MHTIDPDLLFGTGDFWSRFRHSVDVVVGLGRPAPHKLFGVRDGFERYLRDVLHRDEAPSVHARAVEPTDEPLPVGDAETLELARGRARRVEELTEGRVFAVGAETGMVSVRAGTTTRHVVRTWVVLVAPVGLALGPDGRGDEAWGSSGAQEVPQRLVEGLEDGQLPATMPGTRRGGGMVASLTEGHETRRRAAAQATFHAVTSLLYGRLGGPRSGGPWPAGAVD
ncbi:MAG: DUF84 family protein [Acidobacteriota bacterium]